LGGAGALIKFARFNHGLQCGRSSRYFDCRMLWGTPMRSGLAVAALAVLVSGCVTPTPPTQLSVSEPFNPADFAWSQAKGTNVIVGNAVLRTQGGDPRTCAALPVKLIGVTKYSTARMDAIYGNDESGFYSIAAMMTRRLARNPEYEKFARVATCDAQGNFRFDEVPDGAYYVLAEVAWNVPTLGPQGGGLMQRVEVHRGETKHIVLTAPI
jgi:hypothetical protein